MKLSLKEEIVIAVIAISISLTLVSAIMTLDHYYGFKAIKNQVENRK